MGLTWDQLDSLGLTWDELDYLRRTAGQFDLSEESLRGILEARISRTNEIIDKLDTSDEYKSILRSDSELLESLHSLWLDSEKKWEEKWQEAEEKREKERRADWVRCIAIGILGVAGGYFFPLLFR